MLLVGVLLELLREVGTSVESYGASRSKSVAASSTWKSFGTARRCRLRICALLSHSRSRAAAISTGCTALRKTLANAP